MSNTDPFEYHQPTSESIDSIVVIRSLCRDLHKALLAEIPSCAERTLATRKLEEVSMWANKAIVHHQDDVPTHVTRHDC